MDQPKHIPLTAEDTPSIKSDYGLMTIHIHSGELNSIKGPIPTLTPVNTFTVEAKKKGKFFFNIPVNHNAFLYLLNGKIRKTGEADEVDGKYVVILNNDGTGFEVEVLEDTRLIIGTGESINEPIASHGPFVMNTQTEIMEAFRDYELGKMGVLIEN